MRFPGKARPRVSLLIPVFHSADYVGDAISAALAQTWGHVEIIVAPDDGATYAHLRQSFASAQLRILPPGPKACSGPGATRNRALDASSGEFITMLDADDLIGPDYLAALMAQATEHGAAIAPTLYTRWDPEQIVRAPPIHNGVLSLSGFAQVCASVHPLIHRSLEPGYCDGFAEDVVHDGIVIAKCQTVAVVDAVHYDLRIRPGSACNSAERSEAAIQAAYGARIEQIQCRPTQVGMQALSRTDRADFVDLFAFRAFVSRCFSASGQDCYNTWLGGKEAMLWDEFNAGGSVPVARQASGVCSDRACPASRPGPV